MKNEYELRRSWLNNEVYVQSVALKANTCTYTRHVCNTKCTYNTHQVCSKCIMELAKLQNISSVVNATIYTRYDEVWLSLGTQDVCN